MKEIKTDKKIFVPSNDGNILKEFSFVVMVRPNENPCPSDLMNRYAQANEGVYFKRNKYFRSYLEYFGRAYLYDQWEWGKLDEKLDAYPVRVYMSLMENNTGAVIPPRRGRQQ